MGNFFSCAFALCVCGNIKDKLDPELSFYCNNLEWPGIGHADVSWSPPEFWSWFVDFPHFGDILTKRNRSNLLFLDIFLITLGRNWLKFGMLMYPDHLQNWSDFDHGLLIFLIFIMSSLWFHGNQSGLRWLRDATVFSYLDLLVHLYLVISEEMKYVNICILKLSSYQVGLSSITM